MDSEDSIGYPRACRCSVNRGLFPFIKQDNFTSTPHGAVSDSSHCATFETENDLFQTLKSSLGAVILLSKAGLSWTKLPNYQARVLGNSLDAPTLTAIIALVRL